MRLPKETHTAETLNALNSLQNLMINDSGRPCHVIPYGMDLKFCGRIQENAEITAALELSSDSIKLKALSVCGLRGSERLSLHFTTPTHHEMYTMQ